MRAGHGVVAGQGWGKDRGEAADAVEDVVGSGSVVGKRGQAGSDAVSAGARGQRTVSVGAWAGGGDLWQWRDDDVGIADGLRDELSVVIKLEI